MQSTSVAALVFFSPCTNKSKGAQCTQVYTGDVNQHRSICHISYARARHLFSCDLQVPLHVQARVWAVAVRPAPIRHGHAFRRWKTFLDTQFRSTRCLDIVLHTQHVAPNRPALGASRGYRAVRPRRCPGMQRTPSACVHNDTSHGAGTSRWPCGMTSAGRSRLHFSIWHALAQALKYTYQAYALLYIK